MVPGGTGKHYYLIRVGQVVINNVNMHGLGGGDGDGDGDWGQVLCEAQSGKVQSVRCKMCLVTCWDDGGIIIGFITLR